MVKRYRLRDGVSLIAQNGGVFIVTVSPLRVLKVDHRITPLLRLCDGYNTLAEVLSGCPDINEASATAFLEALVRRGLVSVDYSLDEGSEPMVSVVVPVRNRLQEIKECLQSIMAVDYPQQSLEVIVVDDASDDATPEVVSTFPVTLISLKERRGPADCRNIGSRQARGEILAFTDSDCVVDEQWLRDLVPCFSDPWVAAVGGMIKPFSLERALDRYEETMSPLYMGKVSAEVRPNTAISYIPTCNLLVREAVMAEVNGLDETLELGEDVDLCWRIHKTGFRILYVAKGQVYHRHRGRVGAFLKRRADYGISEARLCLKHPRERRTLFLPLLKCAFLGATILGLLSRNYLALGLPLVVLGVEYGLRDMRLRRAGLRLEIRPLIKSFLYDYSLFFYHLVAGFCHYYSLPFLIVVILFSPSLLGVTIMVAVLLLSALADFIRSKPRLSLPQFSSLHLLEHLAYQVGVFLGCCRHRTPLPLVPKIRIF